MCFSSVLLSENIVNTLSGSCFVDKMYVCLHFLSANYNKHKMFICPYLWKYAKYIYGYGLAMLGNLLMCTAYTDEFIVGTLTLRLGPETSSMGSSQDISTFLLVV